MLSKKIRKDLLCHETSPRNLSHKPTLILPSCWAESSGTDALFILSIEPGAEKSRFPSLWASVPVSPKRQEFRDGSGSTFVPRKQTQGGHDHSSERERWTLRPPGPAHCSTASTTGDEDHQSEASRTDGCLSLSADWLKRPMANKNV